uniref:YAE1 maturation factor of ABCE1 n=1 Tax=Chelydra serpentina TaxID=8475 RepID=A0A8C3SBL9_CHESE
MLRRKSSDSYTFATSPGILVTTTMSWVQAAVSQPSEDVFDEDADELHLVQKEWKSTMEKRVKEGYRDGVEAGKELSLQQGFNRGYKQGAEMMMTCGQLKGTLSPTLESYWILFRTWTLVIQFQWRMNLMELKLEDTVKMSLS